MTGLITDLDAVWTAAALVPLAVAAAAWALQMSCGFFSIEPPEFLHAGTTGVVNSGANVILRFVLQMTGWSTGMSAEYLLPAIATSTVIAICLPTGPFSATTITAVQIVLCALMYYALCWLVALVTAPFLM